MVFHIGSNYDYHFVLKEPAKKFEGEYCLFILINCLGEYTRKCKTFLVPITNEVRRIDKNGNEITKTILQITYY